MTRRQFVRATAGIFTASSYGRIKGANSKIGVGFIGLGGRGMGLLKDCFLTNRGVEPMAVCDVYTPHHERAAGLIQRQRGRLVPQFRDFRDLLERPDVDAAVIATPDHWHALMTVEACKAGKDIYLEKPISVAIGEEIYMLEAARKYQRVVQVGTQGRSSGLSNNAVALIRAGILGKINRVTTWIFWVPGLSTEPETLPPNLDWDMWLGPAPYHHYEPGRFRFSWRYYWDYAGGKLTDWGAHLFDTILLAMNQTGPLTISAKGKMTCTKDGRQTPDTLTVTYSFPEFDCIFLHSCGQFQGEFKRNHGTIFVGERGTLRLDRKNYEVRPREKTKIEAPTVDGRKIPLKAGSGQFPKESLVHCNNFVDCIKSREKPAASINSHFSTRMAHLGNIAYKSGLNVLWSPPNGPSSMPGIEYYLEREYRAPWKLNP